MIGGEARATRRIKLITENYFLPDDTGGLFSAGLRIIGERFSTDLALAGWGGDGDFLCCLPLVSFSYAFGGSR